MRLFSCRQIRELDQKAIQETKIPSALLMEHAGTEVASAVTELLVNVKGKKVLIVCGPGNNGGDGLVASRILHDIGASISVYLLAQEGTLKAETAANHAILKALKPGSFIEHRKFEDALGKADCVVDAIFGTGLTRPPEAETAALMQAINESGKPVVAVDLPSGLNADDGKILGSAIRATVTVTLAAPKIGLFLYPGRAYVGRLKIAYISIPTQLIERAAASAHVAEAQDVKSWLPSWGPDIHKGERGKVMILGGSRGLSGAPALAAMAALHSGSGLVYLGVPDGIRTLMEHKLTEVIKVGIPQTNNWVFGKPSFAETRNWFEKIDALAIGPGVGRADETKEYVRTVIQEYKGPLVVDADGLFPLDEQFLISHSRPSMILTPHEGEMARLCGITPEEVHENRLKLAKEKAKKWNVTLLLKGASTLIVSGDEVWINATGNPGMATGGSGDVLTGIIVSLLGQGMDPMKASVAGAFLHGLSGDLLAKDLGIRGVTAERLSVYLFKAFQALAASAKASAL